jgi:hypothetical protein
LFYEVEGFCQLIYDKAGKAEDDNDHPIENSQTEEGQSLSDRTDLIAPNKDSNTDKN